MKNRKQAYAVAPPRDRNHPGLFQPLLTPPRHPALDSVDPRFTSGHSITRFQTLY
jgi:hypothetical protein